MTMTAPSDSSVKGYANPWRRYSDLPPSYDAAEAEPHGFIDGTAARENPIQDQPVPFASGSPLPKHVLSQTDARRDSETTPLFLDPSTAEPRMAPGELLAQCAQHGHVEKTRYGGWSIFAAAVFFPWGLLCLMGSRVVYCERCGLVLRAPRGCKDVHRAHPYGRHPSRYHGGKRRARC